jgi:hypothetical protein
MDNLQPSVPASRRGAVAKRFAIVGLVLCSVPLLGIVAALVRNANLQPGDTDGAMGLGIMYVVVLPWTFAPAAVVCASGAALSGLAMQSEEGQGARTWLAVSIAAPLLVVLCYGVGLWLMW